MKENTTLHLTTLLTKTMCDNFEFIDINKEDIVKVFNKEKVNGISKKEYRTIFQFYQTLLDVFATEEKITFDDILKINDKIEYKIGDNTGVFAVVDRYVKNFGKIYIKVAPQDQEQKEQMFKNLIFNLENCEDQEYKIRLILNFFIEQLTDQWFENGNKRTSFITCNKLLLDYCCEEKNNMLISFENKSFIILLGAFYCFKYDYLLPKELEEYFLNFLTKEELNKETIKELLVDLLEESIYTNNQENIDIKQVLLQQCKSFFGLNYMITDNEIQKLATKQKPQTITIEEKVLDSYGNSQPKEKLDIKKEIKELAKNFTFNK